MAVAYYILPGNYGEELMNIELVIKLELNSGIYHCGRFVCPTIPASALNKSVVT